MNYLGLDLMYADTLYFWMQMKQDMMQRKRQLKKVCYQKVM